MIPVWLNLWRPSRPFLGLKATAKTRAWVVRILWLKSCRTKNSRGRVRGSETGLALCHGFRMLMFSRRHWWSYFLQFKDRGNMVITREINSSIEVATRLCIMIEAAAAVDLHCCRNSDAAVGRAGRAKLSGLSGSTRSTLLT
jgi:hypothetical protein